MTALAADKSIVEIQTGWGGLTSDFGGGAPLAAGVFFEGALVVYDSADGKLKPAITATTLKPAGVSRGNFPAGSTSIDCYSGIFQFVNDGTITAAHVGTDCYMTDDQTVSNTSVGRSVAGKIYKLNGATGVFVAINPYK